MKNQSTSKEAAAANQSERRQHIRLNGWDYVEGSDYNRNADINFNYEDFEESDRGGRAISRNAAVKMIRDYHESLQTELQQKSIASNPAALEQFLKRTGAITFSKRLLLLLLSQKNCEGIRFYVCQRPASNGGEEPVTSLVLVGITHDHKDLGTGNDKYIVKQQYTTLGANENQPSIYAEVGGHDTIAEMSEKMGLALFQL